MKPTHETHPFIYSIFLAPPKQGIYLHLCCRHTSINILISTHLYRRMQILAPFAPLLIHSNLRAICTSVDPLELYPRIYKMQRIHVDKRLLPKEGTSRLRYKAYRNRLLPKEGISRPWYSMYRGKENPCFSGSFSLFILFNHKLTILENQFDSVNY
jgi:hypothetical protein